MAFNSVISSKIPMVIVLGATGTGKTKLGVELAQRFATEIISADSMQVYKGLDIVTAKATRKERELVKHHMLDILEPHQKFTVVDFKNRALKIIKNLTTQGKIPIIVGGTNYYLESIIYNILVEDMNDPNDLLWEKSKRKREEDEGDEKEVKRYAQDQNIKRNFDENEIELATSVPKDEGKNKIEITTMTKEQLEEDFDNEARFTNEEIHARLKAIDPVMASRLHPNNRRKVLRYGCNTFGVPLLGTGLSPVLEKPGAYSTNLLQCGLVDIRISGQLAVGCFQTAHMASESIEHWLKTGRRHSDVLEEQKYSEGQLRRPGATIVLWLKCEQSVHDERLNARVDSMVKEGLISELLEFHKEHNRQRTNDGTPPDYTKGVFQTLGFKEFHEFLMLPEEERNSEKGKKLLEQGIENTKMATRRYARRQNNMVLGRFLESPRREVPPIFVLDTTDVSKWDEEVKNKAIKIIESFLNKSECPFEPLKPQSREVKEKINSHSSNYCEVCERLIIGDKEFEIHMKSYRHSRALKAKAKLAKLQKAPKDTKE